MRIQMLQADIIPLQFIVERKHRLTARIIRAFAYGMVRAVAVDVYVVVLAVFALQVDGVGDAAAVVFVSSGCLAVCEAGGQTFSAGAGLWLFSWWVYMMGVGLTGFVFVIECLDVGWDFVRSGLDSY